LIKKNNKLGFNVYGDSLNKIDFSKKNTINPHSYCVSLEDNVFAEALKMSDILHPDGIGIVWSEKFLNVKKIKKIAGYDLFVFLMNKLQIEKGSVFFPVASKETLNKKKLKVELLGRGFAWLDTDTHDSLMEAGQFTETIEKRQGLKVACLEEIAYGMNYIDADQVKKLAKPLLKSAYGQYLLNLVK